MNAVLNRGQIDALNMLQSVAAKNLDGEERITLAKMANIVAGHTFDKIDVQAFLKDSFEKLQNRHE